MDGLPHWEIVNGMEVREKSVSPDYMNNLVNKNDNEEGGINHMSLLCALAQKISWTFFFSDIFEGWVRC